MKAEAILFYNENKAGVNYMDQMVTHFTTQRSTRLWTFAFFCNMLDTMALAAFCICKGVDGLNKNTKKKKKKTFKLQTNFMWIFSSKHRICSACIWPDTHTFCMKKFSHYVS